MKFNVTILQYKDLEVESEDELSAKEDEAVQQEVDSPIGWNLAEIHAEVIP